MRHRRRRITTTSGIETRRLVRWTTKVGCHIRLVTSCQLGPYGGQVRPSICTAQQAQWLRGRIVRCCPSQVASHSNRIIGQLRELVNPEGFGGVLNFAWVFLGGDLGGNIGGGGCNGDLQPFPYFCRGFFLSCSFVVHSLSILLPRPEVGTIFFFRRACIFRLGLVLLSLSFCTLSHTHAQG